MERIVYFIKKGIVCAYIDTVDGKMTFWFGKEGDTVVSMKSYVKNQKGYETIELLENCILYKLNMSALNRLFAEDMYCQLGTEICRAGIVKNRRTIYCPTAWNSLRTI